MPRTSVKAVKRGGLRRAAAVSAALQEAPGWLGGFPIKCWSSGKNGFSEGTEGAPSDITAHGTELRSGGYNFVVEPANEPATKLALFGFSSLLNYCYTR